MRSWWTGFIALTLLCVGCGGGGGSSKPTTISDAEFTIIWPARTRTALDHGLTSAQSVAVTFKNGGGAGKDVTVDIDRDAALSGYTRTYPVGQDILSNVSSMTANFYSDARENGTLVGTASSTVKVQGKSLEMSAIQVAGTIKHVTIIQPPAINLGADLVQLTASTTDGSGNTVAVTAGSLKWSVVTGPTVLLLTPDGRAQALAAGDATITASVDGITSAAQTISVSALQVQIVPVQLNRMALNPLSGDLWLTVKSTDTRYPNSLVSLSPNNGVFGPSIDAGKEPNLITIASNGHTAYVTIPEDGSVVIGDIQNIQNAGFEDLHLSGVIDLAGMPGSPNSFVTVTDPSAGSNATMWTNGTAQADIGKGGNRVVFSADGAAMYGDGGNTLFQNSVGASGITSTGQKSVNVTGCVLSKGLLYTNVGTVVDPVSGSIVKTLPQGDLQQYNFVTVSAADNRIYYLTASGDGDVKMLSFDQTTYEEKAPLSLGHIPGALHDPIACGNHIVAFESTGSVGQGVVIIRGLP